MVKRLKKFFALSVGERRTLLHALVVIPLVAAALKVWGLDRVQRFLERRAERARGRYREPDADVFQEARAVSSLVEAAGRGGIWRPDCLERSVVLSYLLQRKGIDTEMQLGCRREEGELTFHAWLERDGRVINDRDDVADLYTPFPGPAMGRRPRFD